LFYIFSATRSFALLALGFSESSLSQGRVGFFVISFIVGLFPQMQMGKSFGQVHPLESDL
jgi:uncharacterized membrane protein YiaA